MIKTDIAIIGGGIAGLWTLNRLSQEGFNCILIEKDKLGGIQTLASQGMIHGGQKYAIFKAKKNKVAESISSMPEIWHNSIYGSDCRSGYRTDYGSGEIDLTSAKVLSKNQYMWSVGKAGQAAAFIASKSLNAKVEIIKNIDNLPEILKKEKSIKKIYKMNEAVFDVKSVISALKEKVSDAIYKADLKNVSIEKDRLDFIELKDSKNKALLKASCFIFTAGIGNEEAVKFLKLDGKITQKRPLKQIMVKKMPFSLYGHCITVKPKPRITITAHPLKEGGYVWYLGGLVAEYGVDKTDDEAISFAYNEMSDVFPSIDWSKRYWAVKDIDRAEPYNDKNFLPDNPVIKTPLNNVCIAWPTKMTFAPALASNILKWIKTLNISKISKKDNLPFLEPKIENYPWEEIGDWKKIKKF
jgi:glycerol-3-phosphate dehydrogenase